MAKASPNHQNPSRGRDFATIVRLVLERDGLSLVPEYAVDIGVAEEKRPRKFDLGSESRPFWSSASGTLGRKGRTRPARR